MEEIQQIKKTGRGPNRNKYRLKVYNKTTGEMKHYITANDLTEELGIPESSIYYMIRQQNNSCKKYPDLCIHRCNIDVFKKIKVEI